jgi:hypothetical protein
MAKKRAIERWETKLANCEVTPKTIWPVAKSLTNKNGPKALFATRGPLSTKFYPIDKVKIRAEYLKH